jgi:hypothetical protein
MAGAARVAPPLSRLLHLPPTRRPRRRSFDLTVPADSIASISATTLLLGLDFGLAAMATGAQTGGRAAALAPRASDYGPPAGPTGPRRASTARASVLLPRGGG